MDDDKKQHSSKKLGRAKAPCPFCNTLQLNFSRHIIRQHADNPKVKTILEKSAAIASAAEKTAYRRRAFKMLVVEGKSAYNKRILKDPAKGAADLLPVRRAKTGVTRFYKECPHCGGIFRRVARHKCLAKRTDFRNIGMQARWIVASDSSPPPTVHISRGLTSILATLRDGPVKTLIFQDALLLRWTDVEVRKYMSIEDSSIEDEGEPPEDKRIRRQRRRQIHTSITYKLANESRRAVLCKQLRLLARYVQCYRQKYKSETFTLLDTFRAEHITYASQAVRRSTSDFMKVEQA